MIKVKSFTSPLKVFHTREELDSLDEAVNKFIRDGNITKVISLSDVCTCDNTGATIGIIRVLTYEDIQ
jgi:hypothetical protein